MFNTPYWCGKFELLTYIDHAGDITGKLRYREDGSFVFENAEFTIREGYLKQKVLDMFSAQELQKVTKQLSPEDAHDFSPEETGVDDIRIIAKSSGDDACLYGIYAKDGGATVLRVGDQVYPTGKDGWMDCQNGYLVRVNRYAGDAGERKYVLIWQRASDGDTMVSYFAVGRGYRWIPLSCSGILLAESPRKECALYRISVDRAGVATLLRRQDMWFLADQETNESINWYELTTDVGIKLIDKDCRSCNELWTGADYWYNNDHELCWCSPLLLNHKKLGVIEHTTEDKFHISWYEPERMPNESEYEYFSIDENYQWSETRGICYKKNCYAADGSFEGSVIGYVACHNGTFSCLSPLQSDLVLQKTYDLGGEGNRENMYCEYYESTTSSASVYCIVKNEKVVLRFFEQTKGGASVNLADIDEDGQKELIIIHGWWGSNYDPVSFRVFKEQEDGQWRMLDCPSSLPVGMRMDANGIDGIIFCTGLDKTIIADLDYPMANPGELCTQVGGPEPFEVEIDSREGKTCLKAKFHLDILGGTKFDVIGIATVYFNYDEQGEIHILDLEFN